MGRGSFTAFMYGRQHGRCIGSRPVFCDFVIAISYGRDDFRSDMGGCYREEGKVRKETLKEIQKNG